jgi:hypothetical protein
MKEIIKENINNPEKLEELYHKDKKSFASGFEKVYSETVLTELTKYWKIRLDFDKIPEKTKKANLTDIFVMISACLLAGFLIKIPDLFNLKLSDSLFYEKNAGIIVFLGLTIYVVWINRILELKKLVLILIAFIIPAIYVNLLPPISNSASINLVYIHLPLIMWCIFGLVYIDFNLKDKTKRIEYLKYNGDLAILSAIIMIAGGILTAITIGLFQAIGIKIEKFYMENIVIIGLVSVPIVATFIINNYLTILNKIAPIIANIFSPLVLLTAIIYLVAWATTGKNPYSDREFLLIFNIMLLGVMAVIVFSVSETSLFGKQRFNEMILFILSIVTVIIDMIALSAIFYRLGAFGITPNRLAVLGSNFLILVNLILIIIDLYKVNFKKRSIEKVWLTISRFLPVYIIWILLVIFGLPPIFGLK